MDKISIVATNWAKEFVKNNSNKVKNVEEIYKEGFIKGANLQKEANLNKVKFLEGIIKSLKEQNELNKKSFEKLTDSLNKEKESETLLSKGRIQKLLKAEKILNALESYGVDNWEGYEMAMDSVEE